MQDLLVVLVVSECRFHQHSKIQRLLLYPVHLEVEVLERLDTLMVLLSFSSLVEVEVVLPNQIILMGMMVEHLIIQLLMQQMQMLLLLVVEEVDTRAEMQLQL